MTLVNVKPSGSWISLPKEEGIAFCVDTSVEYAGGRVPVRPLGVGDKPHGFLLPSSEPIRRGQLIAEIVRVLPDEAVSVNDALEQRAVPAPNGRFVKKPAGSYRAMQAASAGVAINALRVP